VLLEIVWIQSRVAVEILDGRSDATRHDQRHGFRVSRQIRLLDVRGQSPLVIGRRRVKQGVEFAIAVSSPLGCRSGRNSGIAGPGRWPHTD